MSNAQRFSWQRFTWQRDAAKAGAPLSREPLAALKLAVAERVRGIEDLQHRVQVQREAAVLLAALAYYFLGYDQGAVSVFGSDTHIHEFIHDSRHFLGFPCH